jgi:hypothetical protein
MALSLTAVLALPPPLVRQEAALLAQLVPPPARAATEVTAARQGTLVLAAAVLRVKVLAVTAALPQAAVAAVAGIVQAPMAPTQQGLADQAATTHPV